MASRSIRSMCTALTQLSLKSKVPQTKLLLTQWNATSSLRQSWIGRTAPFSCSACLQRSDHPSAQEAQMRTTPPDFSLIPKDKAQDLISNVNEKLASPELGRLFAIVHIGGRQRKITTEDILIINDLDAPNVGDRIRLEKVLLVGSSDFTLLGRPILRRDQVCVEATVIEKTLSHYHIYCNYRPRSRKTRRLKLFRRKQTMLVINSIEVSPLSS